MSQKKIVSNVNERKKKQTKWTTHWFIIILKTIVNHNKTWYRSLYTKTILALTESSNVLPRWHNNNQNFHSCKIGDKSKSQSNLCEAILMRVLVEEVGKDHSSSDGKVGLFEQLSWLWSSSILFSGLQRPAPVLYDQSNASLCYWTESWSNDRTASRQYLFVLIIQSFIKEIDRTWALGDVPNSNRGRRTFWFAKDVMVLVVDVHC